MLNKEILHQVVDPNLLAAQPDEWDIVIHNPQPNSIGYATTLTPDVIQQAERKNLDLLVTHHDTWDFMLEEQTISHDLLRKHKISHIWCHEPLDKSDFGTAAALLGILECEILESITDVCGRIGKLSGESDLPKIIKNLEIQMLERPRSVYDSGKPITRIACVPGAGMMVEYLAEALEFGIDLYITGETSLYLLEYASFRDISTLIYSHNYTEIFGTQNLALRIADRLSINKIIRLNEPHF